MCDLQQPGRELGLDAVALTRSHSPAPGFLEQFIGIGALVQGSQEKAVQSATVAPIEHFESEHVASGIRKHQFFVRSF